MMQTASVTEDLCRHALNWLGQYSFGTAGFYRPIRNEPDLTEAFLRWRSEEDGRMLCVPVVEDREFKRMHYSLWQETCVRIGTYGIEEPAQDIPVNPEVIFVPCVGVTLHGFRLGNGAGYFDRWLAQKRACHQAPVTVAVALDCLVTTEFEPDVHDEPMDWILTESGIQRSQQKMGSS